MSVDFIPDPTYVRQIRPPYTSYWLGPFGGLAACAVSWLALAAWYWRKARFVDDERVEF